MGRLQINRFYDPINININVIYERKILVTLRKIFYTRKKKSALCIAAKEAFKII